VITPACIKGNEYFVSFSDFNGTVAGYKGIDVRSDDKGGSIVHLECRNKARMVKYLNSTVEMLIKDSWTVRTNLPQILSLY
jgi:hypothetical protein